jgi:hypothetical protein
MDHQIRFHILVCGAGMNPGSCFAGDKLVVQAELDNQFSDTAVVVSAAHVGVGGIFATIGRVKQRGGCTHERAMSGLLRPGTEPLLTAHGALQLGQVIAAQPSSRVPHHSRHGFLVTVSVNCGDVEAQAALVQFLGELGIGLLQ